MDDFSSAIMRTPQNIRVIKADGVLELVWDEHETSRLPFRLIRQSCRCAACVDEFTGRQILDRDGVPESIHPEDVSLAGNYALKIRWSDQHDSGLFTWTHLQQIAAELNAASD
jgi:DUF971 family protein